MRTRRYNVHLDPRESMEGKKFVAWFLTAQDEYTDGHRDGSAMDDVELDTGEAATFAEAAMQATQAIQRDSGST